MTSIKEAASVTAIYESLGFEESSPAYRIFKATCHAWTESYKNRTGIRESDLTKWKSPTVRHELHAMAEKFLMDHGFEYWPPQTDNVETLQYPCDEDRIAELLEQLFWRFNFNTYRYHKYVRKDAGEEWESPTISYESSVSTFEKNLEYNNAVGAHTRLIGQRTLSEEQNCAPGESVVQDNLVDIASAAARVFHTTATTTTTNPTDAREFGWLGALAQTTESIARAEEDLPAPPRKPIVKLKVRSLPTVDEGSSASIQISRSKKSKDQDDRTRDPSYNDAAIDHEHVSQRRKLTHTGASSSKRTTHGSPAKTLRSSNRKRTQNQKYMDNIYNVDTTDSDESERIDSPETRARRRGKVAEKSSTAAAPNPKSKSSQQQRLSGKTDDLPSLRNEQVTAEKIGLPTLSSASAHEEHASNTDIVARVAPTAIMVSPPAEASDIRTTTPAPKDLSESRTIEPGSRQTTTPILQTHSKPPIADVSDKQTTSPVPQTQSKVPTPRPKITIDYKIVKARVPRLRLAVWEDGKLAGRSLHSVLESVSKTVGRGQIESMLCTLYTPEVELEYTIRKDAEDKFENMKREYSEHMVASYRQFGQEKPFEIRIEPAYSDERRDEASVAMEPFDLGADW
ncbi:hypothetical protein MMC18_007753 [Xylographa bjoerkii]|nr:hypothetical protein [Xylographa bjoerkii]